MKKIGATPDEMAAHVRGLALAHEIVLIESDELRPQDAMMAPAIGLMICRPVIDATSYAVALHEMGHKLHPTGYLAQEQARALSIASARNYQLIAEEAAWEWAEHQALDWTPAMEAVKAYALKSYADGAARLADRQEAARLFLRGRWGW